MVTVYGAEKALDPKPNVEYSLQPDGTVLVVHKDRGPEEILRNGQRAQSELESGGGPLVQDCAGSLFWHGTWQNQPMPSDEKLLENLAKAKADLDDIDSRLDPPTCGGTPEIRSTMIGLEGSTVHVMQRVMTRSQPVPIKRRFFEPAG